MKLIDLKGEKFGRLVVIDRSQNRGAQPSWTCKCECGKVTTVLGFHLRAKTTQSCGCLRSEKVITHGKSKSAEYRVWSGMISRCYNPKEQSYEFYGARGIRVCKRWRENFVSFYEDMGERPSSSHSIDRIDNNGLYAPSNCRWATRKEQSRNKRNNRMIRLNHRELSLAEWSEMLGIPSTTIHRRIDALGWSMRKALTTPV